jgi:hypothetical protein
LAVNPDAVLSLPIPVKRFQAIIWWNRQVRKPSGVVQHPHFPKRGLLDVLGQSTAKPPSPDTGRLRASKAKDHIAV